jgi:hypothetical protein
LSSQIRATRWEEVCRSASPEPVPSRSTSVQSDTNTRMWFASILDEQGPSSLRSPAGAAEDQRRRRASGPVASQERYRHTTISVSGLSLNCTVGQAGGVQEPGSLSATACGANTCFPARLKIGVVRAGCWAPSSAGPPLLLRWLPPGTLCGSVLSTANGMPRGARFRRQELSPSPLRGLRRSGSAASAG